MARRESRPPSWCHPFPDDIPEGCTDPDTTAIMCKINLPVRYTIPNSFPYSIAVPAYSPGPRGKPGLPFRKGQRLRVRWLQPQGGAVGAILPYAPMATTPRMGPYHAKTLAPKWKPVGSSHGRPITNLDPASPRLRRAGRPEVEPAPAGPGRHAPQTRTPE